MASLEQPEASVALAPTYEECCGHRFLRCLEQSVVGETWEVARADDSRRLAFVLPANENAGNLVEFLRTVKHQALPRIEMFFRGLHPVVVVTAAVHSMRERFRECWGKGMPGIPKKELLAHLETAGNALDQLLKTERVQHFDVRPETLLIADENLYLSSYGFMHHLWLPARSRCELPNARYAAPELLQPHISSRCDQFSLAVIYAEMLTGVHPFRQQSEARRLHSSLPDLSLLASAEREIVAKALSFSPSQRFSNSSELFAALREVAHEGPQPLPVLDRVVEVAAVGAVNRNFTQGNSLDYFVSEMLLSVGAPHFLHQFKSIRYKLEPGQLLEHHCAVRLFQGSALLKLEGFREHWQAQRVLEDEGLLVFRLSLPPTFWQKLTGRQMGLEIQVQVAPGTFAAANRSEVVVLIRPYGCSGKTAVSLLGELGPKILESLRGYLHAQAEQRHSERLPCSEMVRVLPVLSEVELAEPIDCVSKDISSTGIGFFLSKMPPSSQIYINLPKVPEIARFAGLAEIVRAQPCGEGWFEVGARFANPGK